MAGVKGPNTNSFELHEDCCCVVLFSLYSTFTQSILPCIATVTSFELQSDKESTCFLFKSSWFVISVPKALLLFVSNVWDLVFGPNHLNDGFPLSGWRVFNNKAADILETTICTH
ncbi:hypothetical protein Hanom_Chr15g01379011 [Helianthus anomalus]